MRHFMLILAVTAMPVSAAGRDPDHAADLVDELAACRAVTESAERLRCLEQAADALVAAKARNDIVILDRAQVQEARRSSFGLASPRLDMFRDKETAKEEEPEIREVSSTLTAASPHGYGYWIVTLEDGSRWQTTERMRSLPPKAGNKVVIRRSVTGAYFASFRTAPPVSIKRLR